MSSEDNTKVARRLVVRRERVDRGQLAETPYQVNDDEWKEVPTREWATASPVPDTEQVGLSSASLNIGELLARGGMGQVRKAVQVDLGRDVAVKTVLAERTHRSDALVSEARAMSVVEHPNVVPLYALERTSEGWPLMVMKRVIGVCWRDVVRNDEHRLVAQLSPANRLEFHLRVFMAVCDAIDFAHSRGVLHLDLKPANIMLGEFREVYVADWGAAASMAEEHRGWLPMADERDQIIGTPAYMAPEMVGDAGVLGEHTDVYLLGATLAEVLNKKPPHARRTVNATFAAATAGSLPEFADGAPRELVGIAVRALSREPAERFPNVRALRAAVADFLSHRDSVAIAHDANVALDQMTYLVRERTGRRGRDTIQPDVHRQIQLLLGECQFGFKRALLSWPGNPEALAGAERTRLVAARYYLACQSYGLAAAALSEFTEGGPTAREREVAALRAELEDGVREKERAARLVEEYDPRPGSVSRARLFILVAALWMTADVTAFVMMRNGLYVWRPWHTFAAMGVVISVVLAGGFVFRRHIMPNRRARRNVTGMLIICCQLMYNHAIGLYLGHTSFQDVATRCAEFGGSIALVGLFIDRRYFAIAATLLVAAPLVAVWPEYGLLIIAAMIGVGTYPASRIWLRDEGPVVGSALPTRTRGWRSRS